MPRKLRTFVGAYYHHVLVFLAATKAEAGRLLFRRIPRGRTEKALARYVAPLYWCPQHQCLWFKRTVDSTCPVLHPRRVPAKLWAGITIRETETVAGNYASAWGEGPVRVTAKQFQQRSKGGLAVPDGAGKTRRSPASAARKRASPG
jgi:hypothetical protein